MGSIFLSDTHLEDKDAPHYRAFISFLASLGEGSLPGGERDHVTDLYLLGDTFDFWFGRGERVYREFDPVITSLIMLKERGVAIHLFEGNHDFFLAEFFAHRLGMSVYEDWGDITIDGFRFLLGHGDLVDGEDHGYLFLRKILRSRTFYLLQRILPLPLVWWSAQFASRLGEGSRGRGNERLAAKMKTFAERYFAQGFDAVILGHCHLPIFHETAVEGKGKHLVLLGDWIRHFTFLHYRQGAFSLMTLKGEHIGSGQLGS